VNDYFAGNFFDFSPFIIRFTAEKGELTGNIRQIKSILFLLLHHLSYFCLSKIGK